MENNKFENDDIIFTEFDIKDVKNHPKNVMTHTKAQITKIKKNIDKYTQFGNVIITEDNFLIKGHAVTESCKELGKEKILAIKWKGVNHLDKGALEVLTFDNRSAMDSDFDIDNTIDVLNMLDEMGADLTDTGFEDYEIEDLLLDSNFNENVDLKDSDDIPEEEEEEEEDNHAKGVMIKCPHCGEEFYHDFNRD